MFSSHSGTSLARDYVRLVQGGRGDYVEFLPDHLAWESFVIPADASWRWDPWRRDDVYYLEYRSDDPSWVKLYYQLKPVSYADYRVGRLYISADDLVHCVLFRTEEP